MSRRTVFLVALMTVLPSCSRPAGPLDVALAYGRAVYASDADAIYQLASEEDRRSKDRATLRAQQPELDGFTREVVRQLASYITATPVAETMENGRATVTVRFRLPDANASDIAELVANWDDDRLARLSRDERRRITTRIAALERAGTLPVLEGDETLRLVKDGGDWRVWLGWAAGVRVHFDAAVGSELPLDVRVTPREITLSPGERVRVTVHATNRSRTDVTTRVGHRIEPAPQASGLALLQCPLFVPITLAPGESRDFVSVYMVTRDIPGDTKAFDVRYEFPAAERSGS